MTGKAGRAEKKGAEKESNRQDGELNRRGKRKKEKEESGYDDTCYYRDPT